MQELTQEAWQQIAEWLGEEANAIETAIEEVEPLLDRMADDDADQAEYERERIEMHKERIEMFRLAAGAVLWVAENAADRCRFMALDAHPPDEGQDAQDDGENQKRRGNT